METAVGLGLGEAATVGRGLGVAEGMATVGSGVLVMAGTVTLTTKIVGMLKGVCRLSSWDMSKAMITAVKTPRVIKKFVRQVFITPVHPAEIQVW